MLTPFPVTKFLVDIVNPRDGETVFDPCCAISDSLFFVHAQGKKSVGNWTAQNPNKLDLTLGSTSGVDINDPTRVRTNTLVSVESGQNELPISYRIEQNYPNPFNPSTTIRYQLPQAAKVPLKIFNVLGQEIASLVDGKMDVGYHQIQWNATVPSGIYFYRLQAGEFAETEKMILERASGGQYTTCVSDFSNQMKSL